MSKLKALLNYTIVRLVLVAASLYILVQVWQSANETVRNILVTLGAFALIFRLFWVSEFTSTAEGNIY